MLWCSGVRVHVHVCEYVTDCGCVCVYHIHTLQLYGQVTNALEGMCHVSTVCMHVTPCFKQHACSHYTFFGESALCLRTDVPAASINTTCITNVIVNIHLYSTVWLHVCRQPQALCAWWRQRGGGGRVGGGEKEWGKWTIRKEIWEGLWKQRSGEGEEEAGGWLSSWRQIRFQLLLNRPNVFFSLSVSGTLFQRVGTSLHCNIYIYASYIK